MSEHVFVEQALAKEKHKLGEVEKLTSLLKQGLPLPDPPSEAAQKLEQLKEQLKVIAVDSEALAPIVELLEALKPRLNVVAELKEFGDLLTPLGPMLAQISGNIAATTVNVDNVLQQLKADLEDRKVLRVRQMSTLGKIDTYLDRWL